jgi:hypothetical protein
MLLGVSLAFAAACATARPEFEQNFFASNRAAHDAWYRLLGTRYRCDTMVVRSPAAGAITASETPVCIAAAFLMPTRIRAWRDSSGIREDWEFQGGSARPSTVSILGPSSSRATLGRCLMRLEGARPTELLVTMSRC